MADSVSLAAQLLGTLTTPSQAAIKAETRLLVQEALNSMDPIDREVLALKHFEQLSTSRDRRGAGPVQGRGRQPLPAGDQAAAGDPLADPGLRGVLTSGTAPTGRDAMGDVDSESRSGDRAGAGRGVPRPLPRRASGPPLKEYIDRHPELADEIREVFPAMAMMENIALADESLAGDADRRPSPARRRRRWSSWATTASSARSAAAAWASSTRPSRSRSAGTSR